MGKINAEWHLSHKMPKNPKPKERFEWHIEHSEHCHCREMSEKLIEEITEWKKNERG